MCSRYGEDNRVLQSTVPQCGPDIADFCDMDRFEQLLKDWAKSTGLATVAIGRDGSYISGCYNFTDFCQNLTRKSPEGLRRCIACDKKHRHLYMPRRAGGFFSTYNHGRRNMDGQNCGRAGPPRKAR